MCLSLLSTKKSEKILQCVEMARQPDTGIVSDTWKWSAWTGKYLTSVSQFQLEEGDASHTPTCCDDQKTQRWAVCPTGALSTWQPALWTGWLLCSMWPLPSLLPSPRLEENGKKNLDSPLQTEHCKKPLKAQAVAWCYTCPDPTRASWEPHPRGRESGSPLVEPALSRLATTDKAGT